jgi:hypothetical protein
MVAGTTLLVTFTWADGKKKLTWEVVAGESPDREVLGSGYTPTCSITGSYNQWTLDEMALSTTKEGCYEKTIKFPPSGFVEFRFLLDRDTNQQIYPANLKAQETTVPVRGPSAGAGDRSWLLVGKAGENLALCLTVADGTVSLTASWMEQEKTWESEPGYQELYTAPYGITGSLNSWGHSPMTPHASLKGVYTFTFTCEFDVQEAFQIAVDGDTGYTIHPHANSLLMDGITEGPNRKGDASWLIDAVAGKTIEISLDFNQTDKRRMVYWKFVTVGPETLKAIGRM